jgi:hypothetical protein
MLFDLLGPIITCAAALVGIRGGFWDVESRRPTTTGVIAAAIAVNGLLVSFFAVTETSAKAAALNGRIVGLSEQLDSANKEISALQSDLKMASTNLDTVRTELDSANRRLARMNNVELLNDYAQGRWLGTAPSGSILKTYGFSCDATVRTESGLKKAEFFIPQGEEVGVPLFGVGGETVSVSIEFPQEQCDGKVVVTGIAP